MNVAAVQNVRSREQWAEIINADWRKSIESIIQSGRDLINAKAELPRGEFGKMIETDLPFSPMTARRLMAVARHPEIAKQAGRNVLPHSWRVLSELAGLSQADFEKATESGLIDPQTTLGKAAGIVGALNTPTGQAWGQDKGSKRHLPSPKEAREIARATNRMVAASDGNLYSGATEEEGAEYEERRNSTYKIIDAISALADSPVDAFELIDKSKDHWWHSFEIGTIDHATEFLTTLQTALKEKRGVVDAQ